MQPPRARKQNHHSTHHGITRLDEYAWLRDENWQAVMHEPTLLQDDIRTHLEAENAYTAHMLASVKDLQDQLYQEMRGRVEEDETSLPLTLGDYIWLKKYQKGSEHPQICRQLKTSTPEKQQEQAQTIIDFNHEAEGKDYFRPIDYIATRAGDRLAWAADDKGSEFFTISIRDCNTGTDLTEKLENTGTGMAWDAAGDYLFYVAVDEHHRPHKIMRHKIGTTQAQDECVYEEHDCGFFISCQLSRSGRYIFISAHDHQTSEAWLIDAHHPLSDAQCICPREENIHYQISDDAARDQLIILTNYQAKDFQIFTARPDARDKKDWQPLIPAQEGQLILDAAAYQTHLIYMVRENALPQIYVYEFATNTKTKINFAEPAYDLSLDEGLEYATDQFRFTYSSMTTPRQTYAYNMQTGERLLQKTQIIPTGHVSENYRTARLYAPAEDGAQIPISLLYHKDTPLDGSAPCLLYGYGSYGITIPASFSVTRLSLVDRGFIYAIAHIRGSKARGYDWFLQGRREHKMNTFTDFIATAKHLIAEHITSPKKISIHGGSAGGLLVGACVNLAPELFLSAVAEVPFVDTLTTMLDETLPLTPPEWPEWGNPLASKTAYHTIAAYSPYDNIAPQDYPHILASAGLTDPRVTYWEPAKWVARLRERRTDSGLTLLHTQMSAGHGGKAGRFNQLQEVAMVYSFILKTHEEAEI